MDRMPDRFPNTASRLIASAVSLVGSADEVRTFMGSTHEDFRAYCASAKEPSWREFDRLVTLIIREQGKIIAHNRDLLREMRERRDARAEKR
jgi:hypothetical protein